MSEQAYNKKLIQLENIKKQLDEKGNLKVNVYNHQGTLLCPKGREPKNPDSLPPLYIYKEVFLDTCDPAWFPTEEEVDGISNKDLKDKQLKVLEKTIGKKAVQDYNDVTDTMDNMLSTKEDENTIDTTRNIIENVSKEDMLALSTCIATIRDVDTYTLHHSLSVGLRFDMALHEIRKYSKEKWFFDTFKTDFDQISFADESIKHHAVGALLHDFGKTGIDQKVLQKKGKLTDVEFDEIKKHPALGVKKLQNINVTEKSLLNIVGNHHASYLTFPHTGQGPLATICSIIDIHDACRSKRCYKAPFEYSKTVEILKIEAKKNRWHPMLIHIMITNVLPIFEKEISKVADSMK